jgi:protein gp37
MENTHISWTDHTFNPWWGCTEVSPGCDNCYARRDSTRYGFKVWGKGEPRRVFSEKHWRQPLLWNAKAAADGTRPYVFCASMADYLDVDAPSAERERLWATIASTPFLRWLLLTKRPGQAFMVPSYLVAADYVLFGVSVESNDYRWRVAEMARRVGRRVFISAEPITGPLEPLDEWADLLAWVITGGESGPHARAADPLVFYRLRGWSVAHGIPFHFKQWGEYDERMVRVGRVKAGRLLHGREWNDRPMFGAPACEPQASDSDA